MPLMCRHRRFRGASAFVTLVAFTVSATAFSGLSIAQPLELPLGLATGSKEAQISDDDGQHWTDLTAVSTPAFPRAMIRTGTGVAWAPLHDGTQFELHECGIVGIYGSRVATVVKIAAGRVLFRLPSSSETILATPTVRFQVSSSTATNRSAVIRVGAVPPNSFDRVGWIIVDLEGNSRIELLQGKILARPVNGNGSQIVEAGRTVEFRVKENGKDTDPDFKTLRDKKLACLCLPCAAWIPATAVASLASLLGPAVAAAGLSFAALGIGTGLGGPPPPSGTYAARWA